VNIRDLATPSFLLDLDVCEANIRDVAAVCARTGAELWPMVKTHKSTAIARRQKAAGAAGFLTGTLDEAEQLAAAGFTNLMHAYPVAGRENLARVISLARQARRLTVALDGPAAARALASALDAADAALDYLIIVDSGLHRFGVPPAQAAELAAALAGYKQLRLKGIATHPGQVYAAAAPEGVATAARAEVAALAQARDALLKRGFAVPVVAAGSTPTAAHAAASGVATVLRPGNYVFYDNAQIALGVVPAERCALTVLATVLSRPRPDTLIIDAGSKCFGLDKGAHGTSLTAGFGLVRDHPELTVAGLSEEVGKLAVSGDTALAVGDKLAVIPNHACAAANLTSWLVGHRQGRVEETIAIDMRGNARLRPPLVQ
jgi:D-serine deaminase-like pyridoxal phosphate-dependent protein